MNKRIIKWEKWKNPITNLSVDNEDSASGNILVRNTPFGLQPSKVDLRSIVSNRIFLGHTNFDIDEYTADTINNVEGVESLEVNTPYMFRLVVGKSFNSKQVRRTITEKLCRQDSNFNFDKDTNLSIYSKTVELRSQEKPWSLYILPNGKYESTIYDDENIMENTIIKLDEVRQRIGGIILTS